MNRKSMVACWAAAACLSLGCLALVGCQTTQAQADTHDAVMAGALPVCTVCGQIKGTAMCCKPGQVACAVCKLVKGSPGCCRIDKGSSEPVALCTNCGQFKGTALCCKPGQAMCAKCGLVKGSPGCCKIDTAVQ